MRTYLVAHCNPPHTRLRADPYANVTLPPGVRRGQDHGLTGATQTAIEEQTEGKALAVFSERYNGRHLLTIGVVKQ